MSKICQISGKKVQFGNNVSKSINKTKRRFNANIVSKKFYIPDEDKWIKLKVSTSVLKTINKKGIEVTEVTKDKPVSKTDIKKGDILLEINNILINSSSQFIQLVNETKKGNEIKLKYIKRNLVNENFEFDDLK